MADSGTPEHVIQERLLWHVPSSAGTRRIDLFPPVLWHWVKVQADGRTIGRVRWPRTLQPQSEATFDVDGVRVTVLLTRRPWAPALMVDTEVFADGLSLLDGRGLDAARADAPTVAELEAREEAQMAVAVEGAAFGLAGATLLARGGALRELPLVRPWMLVAVPVAIGVAVVGDRFPVGSWARLALMVPALLGLSILVMYWLMAAMVRLFRFVMGRRGWSHRRRVWVALAALFAILPLMFGVVFTPIGLGRAQRSSTAAVTALRTGRWSDGTVAVFEYTFTVDGRTVHSRVSDPTFTSPEDSRHWTADAIATAKVCYDPSKPDQASALAPARYRCGDPDVITTDGGW